MKNNKCIDCRKELSRQDAKRCKSCAKKYYWNNHPFIPKKYYCTGCSKEIHYTTWHYGSKKCVSCAHKGKLGHNFKDGRCSKTYYCIDCGKKINRNTALYKSGLCGSCVMKGENRWNYIDGRSLEIYPSEYTLYLRQKIRKRDNYRCQGKNCNITEEEHIMTIGRILDVHHIDYNKQNCSEGNLITLCHKCNLKVNYNRKYWESYFSSIIPDLISV